MGECHEMIEFKTTYLGHDYTSDEKGKERGYALLGKSRRGKRSIMPMGMTEYCQHLHILLVSSIGVE